MNTAVVEKNKTTHCCLIYSELKTLKLNVMKTANKNNCTRIINHLTLNPTTLVVCFDQIINKRVIVIISVDHYS